MLINEIIFFVVLAAIVAITLYILIKGGYRAFRRNWVLAIIALFVGGFPLWALVEMFIEPVKEFNKVA